jgi:hypothetical protein
MIIPVDHGEQLIGRIGDELGFTPGLFFFLQKPELFPKDADFCCRFVHVVAVALLRMMLPGTAISVGYQADAGFYSYGVYSEMGKLA